MTPINEHTETDSIINGNTRLPLHDFFEELRLNRFSVTPSQIADCSLVINKYGATVANTEELRNYMAPVFCNSQEDQVQFNHIFDQYFKPLQKTVPQKSEKQNTSVTHLRKYGKYYIVSAIIAVALLLLYWYKNFYRPVQKLQLTGLVVTADTSDNSKIHAGLLFNDTTADAFKNVTLKTVYSWGDGSRSDTLPYHSYKKDGAYTIKANTKIISKGDSTDIGTATTSANVCRTPANLTITSLKNTFALNETIELSAEFNPESKPKKISWQITAPDGSFSVHQGTEISYKCSKAGKINVTCQLEFTGDKTACNTLANFSFFVTDTVSKSSVSFAASKNAGNVKTTYKIKDGVITFFIILLVVSFLLYNFLRALNKKDKKQRDAIAEATDENYKALLKSFSGNSGSIELPLPAQNYLPLPEAEINDIARQMRRRINDEAIYLNAEKTIDKAVKNQGFFNPVFSQRTRQAEYLVLIDETYANSQQVKLFEYLLELLAKRNVFIEKYYYSQQPMHCTGVAAPGGISLDKLSQKYPGHILLIMGNAHQLLHQAYPVIDAAYTALLNRWHYKAVLTPVSFMDWGTRERKTLPGEIPVLPVDIQGQILLMKKLFDENINVIAGLTVYSAAFYEAAPVDFEDADELYDYCENAAWAKDNSGGEYGNILYQWIAAVAVYPKLRWEFIIAIGKKLLDSHGKTTEMNFTSLLRIARIKWMQEGRLPDYIRLDLLKRLHPENEVAARETILNVLNEINPGDSSHSNFSYEELQVQKLTNEFILYAYDPVKYSAYEQSRNLYQKMYTNSQVADVTGATYLENSSNSWSTLIKTTVETDGPSTGKENIALKEYFNDDSAVPENKFIKLAAKTMLVLTGIALAMLGLLFIVSRMDGDKPAFLKNTVPQKSNFIFYYNDSPQAKQNTYAVLTVDSISTTLTSQSYDTLLLPVTDSPQNVSVTINDITVLDTVIKLDKDNYTVTATTDIADTTPIKKYKVNFITNSNCTISQATKTFYNSLIKQADSALQIAYTATSSAKSTNTVCINAIIYGSSISEAVVKKIQNSFSAYGVQLNGGKVAPVQAAANEIIIYYEDKPDSKPVPKPVVYVQISDKSLSSSAENFRKQLLGKGFDVRSITVQNYNYNSEISYYSANMTIAANTIRQYYNSHYPNMNVQARLRKAPAVKDDYNNIIAVWIKQYEPVLPAAVYKLNNLKFPSAITAGNNLIFAFNIDNSNAGKPVKGDIQGTACVAGTSVCTNFTFNGGQNSAYVETVLNTSVLKAGVYQVIVKADEVSINVNVGTVVIRDRIEPPSCDTIRSYLGKGSGNIIYKGRTYVNTPLQKLGITLVLTDKNAKSGTFEVTVSKCKKETFTAVTGVKQTVKLCDGRVMYFTLLDWQNKAGNILSKEAIFDAIVCKPQNARNTDPPKTY